MATDRRQFIQRAGLVATGLAAGAPVAEAAARSSAQNAQYPFKDFSRQGPKEVVRGKRAVASSQHPIVTQTMHAQTLNQSWVRGMRRAALLYAG